MSNDCLLSIEDNKRANQLTQVCQLTDGTELKSIIMNKEIIEVYDNEDNVH
jgi:hypothetical protein